MLTTILPIVALGTMTKISGVVAIIAIIAVIILKKKQA
jgi:hypothetical protein